MQAHRKHDISDRIWKILKPHLPGSKGGVGRPASDNRLFIDAVFWILRTGAPWRDLPTDYGDWKNTHRRFCRWRDARIWESLLEELIIEPEYEWLMTDTTHGKVHPHAADKKENNQVIANTKEGSAQRYMWPWMRMVCESDRLLLQLPQRIARLQERREKDMNQSLY